MARGSCPLLRVEIAVLAGRVLPRCRLSREELSPSCQFRLCQRHGAELLGFFEVRASMRHDRRAIDELFIEDHSTCSKVLSV